jgi:hypothetical protein
VGGGSFCVIFFHLVFTRSTNSVLKNDVILILSFVSSNLFSAAAGEHDICRHCYHCKMEHIHCANTVVSDMLRHFIAIGSVFVWCSIGSVVSSERLRYLTSHCDPDLFF